MTALALKYAKILFLLQFSLYPITLFSQDEGEPWVRLAVIKVENKTLADTVVKRYRDGASFYYLAREYSLLTNANDGGELDWIRLSDLSPKLQKVVLQLRVQEISTASGHDVTGWYIWQKLNQRTRKDYEIWSTAWRKVDSLQQGFRKLYQLGNYQQAIPIGKEILNTQKRLLIPEHPRVAASLNNLAELYRAQGRYAEAEPLYLRARAILEKVLGPEHRDVATSLNNLAELYRAQGRYAEAEPLYLRVQAILEKAPGPEHPDVAASLNNLAGLYKDQGRYAEAESLYLRAQAIREKVLGPKHRDVAVSLNNLAVLYQAQGRYAEVEPLFLRAQAILEIVLGPEHPEVAASLYNLAGLHQDQGRYAEAESLYLRAQAIREKVHGPEHRDVAASLHNLARLYLAQGRYAEAESLYSRARAILEKVLGSEHRDVAASLGSLAQLYLAQGRYAEAESLYSRVQAIRERVLGPKHPEVAASLGNLAQLYHAQGRYAEAESLYLRARAILEKVHGPEHPDVAASMDNLAGLYQVQGRYAEAEPLCLRARAIREKVLGPEHPDVAASLNNLAQLYYDQGRYAEAEPLNLRAQAIHEKVSGPEHWHVAASLNNLAQLYYAQGRYDEAEPLYLRAQAILEKAHSPEHRDVAASLNNLAQLYHAQGRYAEAEPLFLRARAIWEKVHDPEHPDVATSLSNLATLYQAQDRYAEAESLYLRARAILEKVHSHEHPVVAVILNNLAEALFEQKQPARALAVADSAVAALDETSSNFQYVATIYGRRANILWELGNSERALLDAEKAINFVDASRPQTGGGEETRATVFQQYAELFDHMIAWQLKTGHVEKAIEYAERSRARVFLDQLAAGQIDLRSSIPDDVLAPLAQRETEAGARVAEYQQRITVLRSRKDLPEADKLKQLGELEQQLFKADKDYQQAYQEIKNASPLWRSLITSGGKPEPLSTIQARLVPAKGLMLMYQIGEEESFLLVIPPAPEKPYALPLIVPASAAKKLKWAAGPLKASYLYKSLTAKDSLTTYLKLVQQLSRANRNVRPVKTSEKESSAELLHALWQVLVPDTLWPRIQDCAEIVLIPDGALHLLPFETLVVKPGRNAKETCYWLDDGPVIRYAASATTLYNITQRASSRIVSAQKDKAVLSLSNPIYDVSKVKEAEKQVARKEVATRSPNPNLETVSFAVRSFARGGAPLDSLPGTAEETKAIRQAFETQRGTLGEVVALQQLAANEPNLRQNLAEKRYIHLATHGLVDQRRKSLFSALALTPPSSATHAPSNDGFLQLHEIYVLKISACELAVLSACETNVGEYLEGEGVFALSRGFFAAGARRVIASQWSVNDLSTAEMMGAFFRQIAEAETKGQQIDYALALREAKRKVRSQEKWAEPFFWAPFVMMGKE